jgi:hypothetical protein
MKMALPKGKTTCQLHVNRSCGLHKECVVG